MKETRPYGILAVALLLAAGMLFADDVYLSDMQEKSVSGIYSKYWPGLVKDAAMGADDRKVDISIEGEVFDKGLSVHPKHNGTVVIKYDLNGMYTQLEFYAGISDQLKNGWSEWAKVSENGAFRGLDRKGSESMTNIRIGAGGSVSVYGDGKRIGDTVFVTARTKAELSTVNVTGVDELIIHCSAWGVEPCDAPYHRGGSYPGCPRLVGAAYGDHIVLGGAKLSAGTVDTRFRNAHRLPGDIRAAGSAQSGLFDMRGRSITPAHTVRRGILISTSVSRDNPRLFVSSNSRKPY